MQALSFAVHIPLVCFGIAFPAMVLVAEWLHLRTGDAVLIDAADDSARIADLLGVGPDRPRLRSIVTTHSHQDHWQALGAVAGANGANTAAHPLDASPLPVPPDFLVEHGRVELTFLVNRPGHYFVVCYLRRKGAGQEPMSPGTIALVTAER